MNFILHRTSDWQRKGDKQITLNSLEELVELVKSEGDIIIKECSYVNPGELELEIYDDYRE